MTEEQKIYHPCTGMRFVMRGCEFEVCFAEFGMVRFATIKGGDQSQITGEKFIELQKNQEITGISQTLHAQDQVNGKPGFANLTDDEMAKSIRKIQYASAALAEVTHPNSKRMLKDWIPTYAERIGDANPPAPRTLSEWVRKYLVDGEVELNELTRNKGNRSFRFDPEIEFLTLEAVNIYMEEEHRDAKDVLSYIVGKLAERNLLTKDGCKVATPGERTVRRILSRIDPFLLTRIKKGRHAAEKMARAAGKSITSPRPMHLVQIDTHFLKVFVVNPETGKAISKPYLACAFDVRTRCVVGIYISLLPPSTVTTLGVIKDMLSRPEKGLPGGLPTILVPDNGIEFKNSGVERLVAKLKIQFVPAAVRDPNGKSHVETFFRTLSQFLIQKIKGTTFSGLANRGDYPSEEKAYATLEQIEGYVREWIENEYHKRPHSGTRRVPIQQWNAEAN